MMDPTRAVWIKDPLAILADGAERGVVVQNGKMYACGREPVVRIDASGTASVADGDRIT